MIIPRENVPLAGFTTLKLGGAARYFVTCTNEEEIRVALRFAASKGMPCHILGGGSNTIFSDDGFEGLVVQIASRGVRFVPDAKHHVVRVAAGEPWDAVVTACIDHDLAGVECLSGIPGLAGATPMQNVGAYGQEVAETVVAVRALDRKTLKDLTLRGDECRFGYRSSRFNTDDTAKFVITEVHFRLPQFAAPTVRYPELQKYIESEGGIASLADGKEKLKSVRNAVLALRKRKSMVIDSADPNAQSVGSFFKNPILTRASFAALEARCKASGLTMTIPAFPSGEEVKVPAAWLVEHAGFHKGYRIGGVGVSTNHTLALINISGTARELLALAAAIQKKVHEQFGILLDREPVVVPFNGLEM